MGSARIIKYWLLNAWNCTQMTMYLYYLIKGAPGGGWVVTGFFKNWLLNALKCTQMTLYLYYLIIGAPVEGRVVPELLEIDSNMLENVLIDIVSFI